MVVWTARVSTLTQTVILRKARGNRTYHMEHLLTPDCLDKVAIIVAMIVAISVAITVPISVPIKVPICVPISVLISVVICVPISVLINANIR